MIVYHGSNTVVCNPDFTKCRKHSDFGRGFYLTEDYNVACRWAANKDISIVNKYEIDITGLRIAKLDFSDIWLKYISFNRTLTNMHFDESGVDAVEGAAVDSQMFGTLNLFWQNYLPKKETLLFLGAIEFSSQIVLKTAKALDALHFISYEQLSQQQRLAYKQESENSRKKARRKIDEVKKQIGGYYYHGKPLADCDLDEIEKDEENKPEDNSLSLCLYDVVAATFEAATKGGVDLLDFTRAFLPSKTFERLFYDASIYTQSPYYILEVFKEEYSEPLKKQRDFEDDIAYWFGYLFGFWHLNRGITGAEIVRKYDLDQLWFGYVPLHTQDINYAIDRTIEEGEIGNQPSEFKLRRDELLNKNCKIAISNIEFNNR